MTHSLQAAPLRYAAAGWPVFLLGRTKRPLANCRDCTDTHPTQHDPQACRCLTCHGFYAATREPRIIAALLALNPSGMLAIRTGVPSRLVVVDVDPGNGGRASMDRLIAAGMLVPTRTVRTGSGGRHLYYQHPGLHVRIPCSAGRLAPGIDVRADGGYVVAPPSVHPRTRRPYAWIDETAEVQEMAPALTAALLQPGPAPTPSLPTSPMPARSAGAISHPGKLMTTLLDRVRTAPPGRRRATLYGCARGFARIVAAGAISPADAYAALLEVGLAVGQTERSARAAINGGFTDEGVNL